MAKKDAYYFSHDSNALTDPKILSMRCDYGLEGYGLFWAILEMLRNESTYKLTLDKNTYRAIKMQTGTTLDVEKFINDCINEYKDSGSGHGLFCAKDGFFWSESFLRRMQQYENLKEKRRQAANSRWNKDNEETKKENNKAKKCKCIKNYCKSNANAKQMKYKSNAKLKKVYAKLCKLNEIKLNEIKLNKIKSIYPSYHVSKSKKIKMDKIDEMEFKRIINNCELHVLDPALAIEIESILKEMYFDKKIQNKIQQLNSKNILYALDNYAKANTKSTIKKPKEYFKACIISSLEQTELSTQYDTNTIYDVMDGGI